MTFPAITGKLALCDSIRSLGGALARHRLVMPSTGFVVLVAEAELFLLAAGRCGWELSNAYTHCCSVLLRRLRRRDLFGATETELVLAREAETSSGAEARRAVQGMLLVACLARAGLTVFILERGAWVPYLALPDLAYLATYASLVVFFSEMQQLHVGYRSARIKVAAWASVATVLVVSLLVCTVRWESNPSSRRSLLLRKFLYYELGITYLLLFIAFVYFGVHLLKCVTVHEYRNEKLYHRILVLTSVCGVALCSKGTLFVVAAANAWRSDTLFPSSTGRYRAEAFIALEELLPSLAILALTSKPERQTPASSASEALTFTNFSSSSPLFTASRSPGTPAMSASSFPYGAVAVNHA